MNFHVHCTLPRPTKIFCKKSREMFAKPKKLLTFAIPNRNTGREKRGISSVGRAFEWHSKGQEFDSPMLHKKSSASAGLFLCSKLFFSSPAPFRCPFPSAKLAHIDIPQRLLKGHLPCAEGRNRPVAHGDHRHGAQERHFGAAVWRRRLPGRGKITIFVSKK